MTSAEEIMRVSGFNPDGVHAGDGGYADRLRRALVDSAGLDRIEPPQPLVDGVLYGDSLAWLQGKPGDGKTFVALDLAGCVATATSWHGHHAGMVGGTADAETWEPANVLYLAAEGVSGIRGRVRAWEASMGHPMTGVQFLPLAVQAGNDAEWAALVDIGPSVASVGLIVVDTQARVTVGMEENAARDMGVFVDRLEQLRQATGACILVVHHQGRNGDHMRGSTALEGAASTVLQVTKEDSDVTVKCVKQKDAEPFTDIALELTSYGDSAVLMLGDPTRPNAGKRTAAMNTARQWWEIFGDQPVSVTRLVDAEVASKRTIYRHLRDLEKAGVVASLSSGPTNRYRLTRQPW